MEILIYVLPVLAAIPIFFLGRWGERHKDRLVLALLISVGTAIVSVVLQYGASKATEADSDPDALVYVERLDGDKIIATLVRRDRPIEKLDVVVPVLGKVRHVQEIGPGSHRSGFEARVVGIQSTETMNEAHISVDNLSATGELKFVVHYDAMDECTKKKLYDLVMKDPNIPKNCDAAAEGVESLLDLNIVELSYSWKHNGNSMSQRRFVEMDKPHWYTERPNKKLIVGVTNDTTCEEVAEIGWPTSELQIRASP